MREDWRGELSVDRQRDVAVTLYRGGEWSDLVAGTIGAGEDVTAATKTISQSAREAKFGFDGLATPPDGGDLISISDGGNVLWNGAIESIDEQREERGARATRATARSRDASPLWRQLKWTTSSYPVGVDLGIIVDDVLSGLGLESHEIAASARATGRATPHSTTQLSDLTAWAMLTEVLVPLGLEPWVDAVGRFKPVSRDIARAEDLELEAAHVLNVKGQKGKSPTTHVKVKWLDRLLSESVQENQVLASDSVTAGYFKLKHKRQQYWSKDRRQRAKNRTFHVLETINAGLIPVGTETYSDVDEYHGTILVQSSAWVPVLATTSLAAMQLATQIPDGVAGNVTVPKGRVIHGLAEAGIMLVMMSLGTGRYEIRGEPFDYVHAVNQTEAFASGTTYAQRSLEEIRTDFIVDEEHAQAIAVLELLYRYRRARNWSVDMVDYGAIERGDILKLPGGIRFYVDDYSRNLSRGAPSTLALSGFRV